MLLLIFILNDMKSLRSLTLQVPILQVVENREYLKSKRGFRVFRNAL